MDVNAVNQTAQSSATQAGTTLAEDFDTFLSLLTTQLQYQDPLSPMDSSEFTNQLVAFTGVEQSIATNKNLETVIAQNHAVTSANAVNYIGKEITVATDKAGLGDNGKVTWEYDLSASASTNKIYVKDQNGIVVHEATGELSAGSHSFTWDAPEDAEEGVYSLTIEAKSGADETINTNIFSRGEVTGVENIGGQSLLAANGILVSPTNVMAVREIEPTESAESGT